MASEKTKSIGEVVLADVRLSYPHLDEPDSTVANGPKKYSASFIIDPNTASGKRNIAAAKKAFHEAAEAQPKWKGKVEKILKAMDTDRKALRKGDTFTNDEGDVQPEYEGMVIVKATRPAKQKAPKVLNRRKDEVEVGDDQFPYGGCYVDAIVRFYSIADVDKGGNGVFCGLEAVRFRRDGESFGNSTPVDTDAFEDLEDDDDEFDVGDGDGAEDDDGLV